MVEDYKKYYYGRTDMIMLNDEKVYGSLGINLQEVTAITEGTGSVILHNSLKRKFKLLELSGNSKHKTYEGNNLLNYELYNAGKTENGVTFEPKKDGSVVVSGESTGTSTYYLGNYIDSLEDGKSYIYESESPNGLLVITYNDETPNEYKKIVTVDKSRMVSIEPNIQFRTNNPLNGTKQIYPMLNEGTAIKPWEPATGGKPVTEPTPDIPLEITSAGRKSKNLFDINYFKNKNNLQTIQCEGFSLLGITCNVKPNTEYTLSANVAEAKYNLNIANKTKRLSLVSSPARTLMSNDDGTLYIGIFGVTADKVNMDDFMQQYKNIQLEEGSKTDYEPYGYLLDLKVTGKNLLNLQKEPDVAGTYWGWKVGDGEKYIMLSIKDKGNNADITNCYLGITGKGIDGGGGLGWLVEAGKILKSEIKTTMPYVSIYPTNRTIVQKLLSRFDIQVEYGETATSYEPYTEQTVQIALNEPLRGIGEYKDTITKDGVVRKIKRIVLDGSENWAIHKEKETTVSFQTNSFKFLFPTHNTMLVDKFAYVISGMNKEDVSWSVYGSNFYININKDIVSNLESFKIWLSKNTLTVEYIAIEPTTEPLPESVQAQLAALHSENGTTHVFVDSGEVEAGIKAEYYVGA